MAKLPLKSEKHQFFKGIFSLFCQFGRCGLRFIPSNSYSLIPTREKVHVGRLDRCFVTNCFVADYPRNIGTNGASRTLSGSSLKLC